MEYSHITFVSAFIIPPKLGFYINIDTYIYNFKLLASSGMSICLFASSSLESHIVKIQNEFPNVKIIGLINYEDLWTTQLISNINTISLPTITNPDKDTHEYMNIMNFKLPLLKHTVELNPFNSTHFSWIDFGILKLSRTLGTVLPRLSVLASNNIILHKKFLFIPGGMPKCQRVDDLLNGVYWRFFGGFLIGDGESILDFANLSEKYYKKFIETYSTNVWEVNIWAWMEMLEVISPSTLLSSFSDDMLLLPSEYYTIVPISKMDLSTRTQHNQYRGFFGTDFHPSSSAFIRYNDKNILNTRYINYWIRPSGYFTIENARNYIVSKNAMFELDSEFNPISCKEVSEENLPLQDIQYLCYQGIEDCRLFEYNHKVCFIGTNYDRISTGKLRIVMGTYETNPPSFQNFQILEPPIDTNCEKNWVPFIKGDNLYFIYQWYPFCIGSLHGSQLNIIYEQQMNPIFEHIRGSSLLVKNSLNTRICVVHYCEYQPFGKKTYMHRLLEVEETAQLVRPIRYSKPFCFDTTGIEYCIGFYINQGRYCFWVSIKDRNPTFITIPITSIELENIPLIFA